VKLPQFNLGAIIALALTLGGTVLAIGRWVGRVETRLDREITACRQKDTEMRRDVDRLDYWRRWDHGDDAPAE
jgi:hypothetical protein